MKDIKFIKLANKWFVKLPYYNGDILDLEMVMGADELCESLNNGTNEVNVTVSTYNDIDYDLSLEFMYMAGDDSEYGVYYMVRELGKTIYLCKVAKQIFDDNFPVLIYIKANYKFDEFWKDTKNVFEIHNLAYQGVWFEDILDFANMRKDIVYNDEYINKKIKKSVISQYLLLTDKEHRFEDVIEIEDYGTATLYLLEFSGENESLSTNNCVMIR